MTKPSSTKSILADFWPLFLTMIISLGVYVRSLAPTVLLGDGGEFQFVAWLPGIAHPTGYPLYTLLGWLFSRVFALGEVAWRVNLFSALTGAVAVGIVYLIAYQLTTSLQADLPTFSRQMTAVAAGLIFAFGQTFWSQAIIAEVYSLHALIVAALLWLTLRLNPSEPPSPLTLRQAWPIALVFGLGMAHHRTTVLLLPALAVYLWLSGRRRVSLRDALGLVGVASAPNLLYLYLPLIAPSVPYAQLQLSATQTLTLYENTPQGFIDHLLARVFTGEVQPGAVGLDRLWLSWEFLRQQVGWLGGLLGVVGLGLCWRRPALFGLTLVAFVSFWGFNLMYFIGDIQVLFIPNWLILSLWITIAWAWLAEKLSRLLVDGRLQRPVDNPIFERTMPKVRRNLQAALSGGFSAILLILPLVLVLTRFGGVDQSQNTLAHEAWQQILAQDLPAESVLVTNDRNEIMPLWYFQFVQNQKPSWLGLFPLITPEPEFANVGRVLEQALASGRPVYLIKPLPGLSLKADLEALPPQPLAQLMRARPISMPDNLQTLNFNYGDALALTGVSQVQTSQNLTVTLFWEPLTAPLPQNYTSYVHLLDAEGQGITQSDQQPGGVVYPSTLWQAGEVLRDRHELSLPPNLPPGEYTLVAGLYAQPEPGQIEPLGERQVIGSVRLGR
jgi:hypothetical protein